MSTEEITIIIIGCIWLVGEIIGTYIFPGLRIGGAVKEKGGNDRGSRIFLWLSMLVSITIAIIFALNGIGPVDDWSFYAGIVLVIAGIVLRRWSVWTLGQFYSTVVRIVDGHRMVRKGPYSVIRHPAYAGSLLSVVGLGLALKTWAGLLILVVLVGLAYYYRISIEEKALKNEFGTEYTDYAKTTRRLIPYVF